MARAIEISPAREAVFWSYMDRGDAVDCWPWRRALNDLGYGSFSVNGKTARAYRVAYTLIKGAIPDGLVLDHLCRNPSCCNPSHLEPVTQRVNTLRGIGPTASNAVKTHCGRGHLFTEENLYICPKGWRKCRTCKREWDKGFHRNHREARLEKFRERRRKQA